MRSSLGLGWILLKPTVISLVDAQDHVVPFQLLSGDQLF